MSKQHKSSVKSQPTKSPRVDTTIKVKEKSRFFISAQCFEELVKNSNIFVDKSLFIKDIIEERCSSILITRPRRWGKTINLDMLKVFLQPDVDAHGNFNFDNKPKTSVLFEGGTISNVTKTTFRKLEISKVQSCMKLHNGQYPVIFVTFDHVEASQGTFEGMGKLGEATIHAEASQGTSESKFDFSTSLGSIKLSISRMFRQHEYLHTALQRKLESDVGALVKHLEDMHLFNRLAYGVDKNGQRQTFDDLEASIYHLSRLLYQHFEKKVYVLVDEYDAPINSSFGKSYFNYVVNVMHHIFKNGTKGNEYVEKTVMIGSLLLAKDKLLSGFDHFSDYTVHHCTFSEHFGFTQHEIDHLLGTHLQGTKQELAQQKTELKNWYNGYCIGEDTLYNPCSILMCLETSHKDPTHALGAYWVYTGSLRLIEEAFMRFDFSGSASPLTMLISKSHVSIEINKHVVLSADNKISPSSIFSLMLHAGYLTRDPTQTDVYKIPNTEIKRSFYQEIVPIWMEKTFGTKNTVSLIDDLVGSIENIERYKQVVQGRLLSHLSCSNKTEADFQALLGGIAMLGYISRRPDAKHDPQLEATNVSQTRIDTMFSPLRGKSSVVIIHEYKKSDKTDEVEKLLDDALWQICTKRYMKKAIEQHKQHTQHSHWKEIIIRSVLFFKSEIGGGWSIQAKEHRFTMAQAEQVDNTFAKHMTREKYLGIESFRTLDELLHNFSTR